MAKIQIVLIGCGGIANAHMQTIRTQSDRAEVVAAVDIDETRARAFAENYDIPAYTTDLDAALRDHSPDFVIIASSSGEHPAHCCRALEAGAHVLCEKPLAGSLADLDQIEATAQRMGRSCTSVMQWRYGSGGQHVKRLIEQGALGQPRVGICQTTWFRSPDYYAIPWRGKWATELGGASVTLGIHAVDFFLWLMGDWQEVGAMVCTLDREIEVENIALANVRFRNGALASVINSALSPRQTSYIRIDCQKATVELEHLYHYTNDDWTFSLPPDDARADELAAWQAIPDDVPASIPVQVVRVVDALEAGTTPWPGPADVRPTIEFLTAMYKSAFTGQQVERGSITPDDPFYYCMNGVPATLGKEVP